MSTYPIMKNKKRVDLVLKDLLIPSGYLEYRGDVQLEGTVDFGASTVIFKETEPVIVNDLTASGNELYVIFGKLKITGKVILTGNSKIVVVEDNLRVT